MAVEVWGWETQDVRTWENIYFLDQITSISVLYDKVMEGIDVFDNRSFQLLNSTSSKIVLENLNISDKIGASEEKPNLGDVRRDIEDDVDVRTDAPTRKEHKTVVHYVFKGLPERDCAICGRVFPRSDLRAAHIKKRSRCFLEEKKDVENIAASMCEFGCDALYENGLISIGKSGEILINSARIPKGPMEDHVSGLEGRICVDYSSSNARYFRWHRKEHGLEALSR